MDLTTKRLLILPIARLDVLDIHKMNSLPEVAAYNTIGIPKDISVTEELLEILFESGNTSTFSWTLRLKSTQEFIGSLGMRLASPRFKSAEIHYSLLPKFWNNGYATEAVKKIVKYGFEDLCLHRIVAGVATENQASINVLEKVGMIREGVGRKILPIQGEWKDNYRYAILAEDLPRS